MKNAKLSISLLGFLGERKMSTLGNSHGGSLGRRRDGGGYRTHILEALALIQLSKSYNACCLSEQLIYQHRQAIHEFRNPKHPLRPSLQALAGRWARI